MSDKEMIWNSYQRYKVKKEIIAAIFSVIFEMTSKYLIVFAILTLEEIGD